MRFKLNTTITWTKTNLAIKDAVERACQEMIGPFFDPLCTSGLEGDHSEESGHFHGRALDIRTSDMPAHTIQKVCDRTQEILGPSYLALLEPTHMHVQRYKDKM